jgi:alkylhydroperoxidase family enzyme
MAKGAPKDTYEDVRESLAVNFALLVAEDPHAIDDEIIDVLKEKFSDSEISELCAFVCFIIASQLYGKILDLEA